MLRSSIIVCALLAMLVTGCGSTAPSSPGKRDKNSDAVRQQTSLNDSEQDVQDDVQAEEEEDQDDEDVETIDGDDEDENEDESDSDTAAGNAALVIKSESRDDGDLLISVRAAGGEWRDFPWPEDTLTVDGLCKTGKKTRIEVRALDEDKKTVHLVILSSSAASGKIGYEDGTCDGAQCEDDNVATLSCTGGEIDLVK